MATSSGKPVHTAVGGASAVDRMSIYLSSLVAHNSQGCLAYKGQAAYTCGQQRAGHAEGLLRCSGAAAARAWRAEEPNLALIQFKNKICWFCRDLADHTRGLRWVLERMSGAQQRSEAALALLLGRAWGAEDLAFYAAAAGAQPCCPGMWDLCAVSCIIQRVACRMYGQELGSDCREPEGELSWLRSGQYRSVMV